MRIKNKTGFIYAKAGFTLVELLIVIAIVGVLSSIVLVSLNSARDKAKDAKIKSQVDSVRDAAVVFFDQNNSYNGLAGDIANECTTPDSMFVDTGSGMAQLLDEAVYPLGTSIRCSSTNSAYMVSASLSTPGQYWCVDSESISRQISETSHELAHTDGDTSCN